MLVDMINGVQECGLFFNNDENSQVSVILAKPRIAFYKVYFKFSNKV